jgi:flagella basal body P-ring formation protein FlgA
MRSIKLYLILLLALLSYQTCQAGYYEKSERINETVKNFIIQNTPVAADDTLDVQVNQAQVALNVPVCSKDITPSFPIDANREQLSSVELTCKDVKPWHIVVPVEVQIFTKVIVAKHTIASKESISEGDIDYVSYNKNRLYNGFFTKKEDVLGNQTAYLVPAGAVLTKKNIQLPILVSRNQSIIIVAQMNSIIVSMQGIARTDGALNSVIKVYNPSSKRTLDAVVVGPNKAQIVS